MSRTPGNSSPLEVPDIAPLRECERGALLIRHAARHGKDVARHTDPLTPAGREAARRLGEKLTEHGRLRLFSSPIQRCIDTATLIAEGAGSDSKVTISTMLGKPGTYVIDEKEVDSILALRGLHGFAVDWVGGKVPVKAMAPVDQGSEAMIRWVLRQLEDDNDCLDVYVGHDLFLTPVLVHYLGYDLVSKGLLGFLDGFTVTRRGNGTVLSYREQNVRL